ITVWRRRLSPSVSSRSASRATCCGAKADPPTADKIPYDGRSPVTPELSVVIPIHNEAASLVELHRELTDTLVTWGRPYEILFIDDGSSADSFKSLPRLQSLDTHLRIVRFRRNFGQTAAF